MAIRVKVLAGEFENLIRLEIGTNKEPRTGCPRDGADDERHMRDLFADAFIKEATIRIGVQSDEGLSANDGFGKLF